MEVIENLKVIFEYCLFVFYNMEMEVGKEIVEKFGLMEMEVIDEVFESE